jgi:hypothetical protein
MKRVTGGARLLTMLAIGLLAAPLFANNQSTQFKRTVMAPRYDARNEVTVAGTVQSFIKQPAPGMMMGAHLVVSTAQGTVDAQIGRVAWGPHAVSFAPGESVKLVGVMATINHQNVFLARTIQTGSRTITVRNERGFFATSGAQTHATHFSSKGGAR